MSIRLCIYHSYNASISHPLACVINIHADLANSPGQPMQHHLESQRSPVAYRINAHLLMSVGGEF